jgi:multiple sugar transport system substrate-binding protein
MVRGQLAVLGGLLAIGLTVTACTSSRGSAVAKQTDTTGPITFAAAAGAHGSTQAIVSQWNSAHPGEQVSLKSLPADPDAQHADLLQNLAKPAAGYDVVSMKTSGTAEFAAQGWLQPLTGSFAVDTTSLMKPAVASATYDNQIYAAPIDIDAGLLYYRSDLVPTAPTTWAQLVKSCPKAKATNLACYAGQFAKGPDLTANVLEAIAATGGQVPQPAGKTVNLNATQAKNGLQLLADSYRNGVIPKSAITYTAAQTAQAFSSGSLLFMRDWASAYPSIASSSIKAHFKVALLPGKSGPAASALDGTSVGLNVATQHKKTAVAFMKFLESPDVQRLRLKSDSAGPVLLACYDDAALRTRFPILSMLQKALQQAQVGPISQFYPAVSQAIQDSSYPAISGDKPVSEAVTELRSALASAG